jgi:hypothetical protein
MKIRAAVFLCLFLSGSAAAHTAEDLFVLAALTGPANARVILSPVDFRTRSLEPVATPGWTSGLYAKIRRALSGYQPENPPPSRG